MLLGNKLLKSKSASFSINQIPGLSLNLNASVGSSLNVDGGDRVDVWADLVSGWTFTQATTSYKPSRVLNGLNNKNVVRFTGNGSWLACNNFSVIHAKSQLYFIWLSKFNGLGKNQCIFSYGTPPQYGEDFLLGGCTSSGTQFNQINNGSDISFVSAFIPNTNWSIKEIIYDGSQSSNADKFKFYINGVEDTINFLGTVPPTSTSWLTFAYIGTYMGAPIEWTLNGDVAQFLIYNTIPGSEARANLRTYLSTEWNF